MGLESSRQRATYGERIRTVRADLLTTSEAAGPLPELTVLGGRPLYRVLYGESGIPHGAVRYTDGEIIENWVSYIRDLYDAGEDLASYFDREVARLAPPKAASE